MTLDVVVHDRVTGALGQAYVTPTCTGQTFSSVAGVSSMNGAAFIVGQAGHGNVQLLAVRSFLARR